MDLAAKGERVTPIENDDTGFAMWWPVLAASVVIAGLSLYAAWFRIAQPFPRDPWESIIVAEGYRASAHLPVYTDGYADHSTHMYGPLLTYLLGAIYKSVGVGLLPSRLIAFGAAMGIVATLSALFFRRLPLPFVFAGVAMLLSLNLRTRGYFTQSRPDMLSLAIALIALIFLCRGLERGKWIEYAIGVLVLCVAYLFKQTTAMFSLVPLIVALMQRETWSARVWLLAACPFIAIVIVIAAIKVFAPMVHYYLVEVLDRWPMEYGRLVLILARFVSFSTLLPLALILWLVTGESTSLRTAPTRWLTAACLVAVPASIAAYSKEGGELNSYLPAFFPLTVVCILLVAQAWTALFQSVRARSWQRYGFVWLFALMMLATSIGAANDELRSTFGGGLGDDRRARVIDYVRQLHGRVVCPDDPTIPILALHQVGRATWAEHDAFDSPAVPDYFAKEVRGADWVILIDSPWPMFAWPDQMRISGFTNVGWDGAKMGPYSLWHSPSSEERVPTK